MASKDYKERYNVTDGPSKFDLMLALFDSSVDRPLRFSGGKPGTAGWRNWRVYISGVERGGSKESWIINGSCKGALVMLYYSTQSRTGEFVVKQK